MKKILLLLACFSVLACGCQRKKVHQKPLSDDFESLTGKDLPTWDYVKTQDDFTSLDFFKRMYELRKGLLSGTQEAVRIPKVAHFIWIGPKPFPRESVENIRTWIAKNPDWTFYFWTDRDRPLPNPTMKMRRIQDINFLKLRDCFNKSVNYGEKSDLLRLEILYKEGGVYIDHDVECYKPFEPLNTAYDFYCGIDMPYTISLPSCINPTNNLIGVKAGHPILIRCMDLLVEQWDKLEEDYPGAGVDEVLNRVIHRTFYMFGEAIRQVSNQEGNRDIVFPAYYFDAPYKELSIYARHLYAGIWHENESAFEKMVRQRLMYLSKKSNKILLFVGVMSGVNCLGLVGLYILMRRRRA